MHERSHWTTAVCVHVAVTVALCRPVFCLLHSGLQTTTVFTQKHLSNSTADTELIFGCQVVMTTILGGGLFTVAGFSLPTLTKQVGTGLI